MALFRNLVSLLFLLVTVTACNSKKKPVLSGDEPVEVADFIDFFPEATMPFQFTEEQLAKKEKDSLLISHKIFTQFAPDTLITKVFGKTTKAKIYPLGKSVSPDKETYLFVKVVVAPKSASYIIAFDKNNKYISGIITLRSDMSKSLQRNVSVDKKYTITRNQTRKNPDGSVSDGRDVYVLNSAAGEFTLIMTESLEDKITELINPIDTLARKNKLSGDYTTNKLNLVSIRDSKRNDRLNFFVHFEKSEGACTGELKGEAIIRSPTLAEYRVSGDPCVLQFKFSATSVTLHEVEGCGSHRGLRCQFDATFPRKKETAKAKPLKVKPSRTK